MSDGILNQVSFKLESDWGTPAVPDKSFPVHFGGGMVTDIDLKTISAVKATIAKNQDTYIGNRTHAGEYETDLFTGYAAHWFYAAMGAKSSGAHSGESSLYDHVLTEAVDKPSMTVEQKFGELVKRFAGVTPTGFKLSIKPGETALVNFPVIGKSQADATAISPTYETIRPLNFADFSIQIDDVAVTEIASIEVEYKNNLTHLPTINGSNDASFRYVKGSEISIKVELYLDDATLAEFTDYLAKASKKFEIIGAGEAFSSTSDYGFLLTLYNGVYKKAETKLSEDYNLLSLEVEGIYDTVSGKMFDVTFTNALASLT